MHSKIKQGVNCEKNVKIKRKIKSEFKRKKEKRKGGGASKKELKEKIAFTWLQACFLGDVRAIWYNSLGDNHFQTCVIDYVESVFNFFMHITFLGNAYTY